MTNCFYSSQGELLCQKEPLYVDSTGVMLKKPHTTLFWDNVVPLGKNAVCFSELPCCEEDENKIINKKISCKPDWCCNKN
jgi:hypothetical protein